MLQEEALLVTCFFYFNVIALVQLNILLTLILPWAAPECTTFHNTSRIRNRLKTFFLKLCCLKLAQTISMATGSCFVPKRCDL